MEFKEIKPRFDSVYDQYKHKNGLEFEILKEIDSDDLKDAEILPMYLIRFEDGEVIEAWPEEIFFDID